MRLNYIDNIDCLEGLKEIPDGSVDLIVTDLPYGVTDCKWDKIIPFEDMWAAFKRVMKPKGVCVLFGQQPFMSMLISSNYGEFSHCWYWAKNSVTGFLNAKRMPLKNVEEIAVFVLNVPSKNNEGLHLGLRQYFFRRAGTLRQDTPGYKQAVRLPDGVALFHLGPAVQHPH